jgi:carboxylesterase type B
MIIRFLQFGSPHGLSGQAQFIAAERKEVWVNIGYRLSAFGFLACDMPKLDGNYGFKDQWLALEWIKENISAFGGRTFTALFPYIY